MGRRGRGRVAGPRAEVLMSLVVLSRGYTRREGAMMEDEDLVLLLLLLMLSSSDRQAQCCS